MRPHCPTQIITYRRQLPLIIHHFGLLESTPPPNPDVYIYSVLRASRPNMTLIQGAGLIISGQQQKRTLTPGFRDEDLGARVYGTKA